MVERRLGCREASLFILSTWWATWGGGQEPLPPPRPALVGATCPSTVLPFSPGRAGCRHGAPLAGHCPECTLVDDWAPPHSGRNARFLPLHFALDFAARSRIVRNMYTGRHVHHPSETRRLARERARLCAAACTSPGALNVLTAAPKRGRRQGLVPPAARRARLRRLLCAQTADTRRSAAWNKRPLH